AALESLATVAPERALPLLQKALEGSVVERRVAYAGLAKLKVTNVDELFVRELQNLEKGGIPSEAALDLVIAAERRKSKSIDELLAAHRAKTGSDPKTAAYAD